MKQSLVLGAVGALLLVPVTATAQAFAPVPRETIAIRTTLGKSVSLKGGKLRVAVGGKGTDFIVNKTTECGVTREGRGALLRCAVLGQKGYRGKRVRVGWHTDVKKRRVALFVTVILG